MGNFFGIPNDDNLDQTNKPPDNEKSRDQVSSGEDDSEQIEQESGTDDSMSDSSEQGSWQTISEANSSIDDNSEQADTSLEEQIDKSEEQVMNALVKMTIEPGTTAKKFKLTPECKCSYLEHYLRLMLENKDILPTFLKNLFVSNVFLSASRHYPIYCLTVAYRPGGVIFSCSTVSLFKTYDIKDVTFFNRFVLGYERMSLLLQLLKPNHSMAFLDPALSDEIVKKAVKNLDFTKGKISLCFEKEITTGFANMLNHFANRRLDIIACASDLLTALNFPLQIGYYASSLAVNNVKLHNILRHNIESIGFVLDEDFVANLDNQGLSERLKPNICDSLKKIKVFCNRNYEPFMSFLDDVKDRCPNLKMLDVEISFFRDRIADNTPISDADGILDCILAARENIRAIVEKCRPLVSNLKISSDLRVVYFSFDNQPLCDWTKRAKTLDFFRTSDHKHNPIPGESIDVCKLISKFEDGFLQLEHSTEVVNLGL